MFTSLQYLPLADAIAIVFVMPFFMVLLGHFVLGEEVGPNRLIACLVGFGGTMLVIQPNFVTAGAIAFLPVGVAVVFAFFMLVTRQIAKEVEPVALQAVSGTLAVVLLAPAVALGVWQGYAPLSLVTPSLWEGQMLVLIGVLGTGAHLLMTWSLRFAPSTTLAPMQYLEIPVAALVGFIIFAELPNSLAAIGIAITVASGVYVVLREQATARRLARSVPPTV
jgi:drug/metabolite transporter (DMT)-like permease